MGDPGTSHACEGTKRASLVSVKTHRPTSGAAEGFGPLGRPLRELVETAAPSCGRLSLGERSGRRGHACKDGRTPHGADGFSRPPLRQPLLGDPRRTRRPRLAWRPSCREAAGEGASPVLVPPGEFLLALFVREHLLRYPPHTCSHGTCSPLCGANITLQKVWPRGLQPLLVLRRPTPATVLVTGAPACPLGWAGCTLGLGGSYAGGAGPRVAGTVFSCPLSPSCWAQSQRESGRAATSPGRMAAQGAGGVTEVRVGGDIRTSHLVSAPCGRGNRGP